MSIPSPIRPFADYRQWILWAIRMVDGKLRKVPISPYSLKKIDAHESQHWVDYDQAETVAAINPGHGVGFVFSKSDPFYFIDLDHVLDENGQWMPIAQTVISMFPGAAVEVSNSGEGLHIFGRAAIGPHRKKVPRRIWEQFPALKKVELYTELRFAAITGTNMVGDASIDHTHALQHMADLWFPGDDLSPDGPDGDTWADMPVAGWSGPSDDDELIRSMLGSQTSAASLLTGRAGLRELWNGEPVEVLAATYPPDTTDDYDRSLADAALAQHLAWWTGNNTERMRRLMLRSGLVRAKWTEHKNYLWLTISNACNMQDRWLDRDGRKADRLVADIVAAAGVQPLVELPAQGAPMLALPPTSQDSRAGSQWMPASLQHEHFKGCVYVVDDHKVFDPRGTLLKPDQFRVLFGGYIFSLDLEGTKTTVNAWQAFTESRHTTYPRVDAIAFRPELPSGTIIDEESRTYVNTYVPIHTKRVVGDASKFLDHVRRLVPDPRDQSILITYMASLVRNPGVKFQWWPVLQGVEGNGKTTLIRALSYAVGIRYTHLPNSKDLAGNGGKFTGWLRGKLFLGIEEIDAADRHDILEVLKPLVTNDRMEIQSKGSDQLTGDNRANGMMACNRKESMAVGVEGRRYAVFYTAQQRKEDLLRDGMTPQYFVDLYSWLKADGYAIINEYLRTCPIAAEFDPAGLCISAPNTTSYGELKILSRSPIEQEIAEAVGEGRPGFSGGWVSSSALEKLLQVKNRTLSVQRRHETMERLGYMLHPHLEDGRTVHFVPFDGTRPKLYMTVGHLALNLTDPGKITEAYVLAQGSAARVVALPPSRMQQ